MENGQNKGKKRRNIPQPQQGAQQKIDRIVEGIVARDNEKVEKHLKKLRAEVNVRNLTLGYLEEAFIIYQMKGNRKRLSFKSSIAIW